MKKYFLSAVLFALILSGCSSSSGADSANVADFAESFTQPAGAAPADAELDYSNRASAQFAEQFANTVRASGAAVTSNVTPQMENISAEISPVQRKITKNASISMEVEDVETAYADISALLANNGGYEAGKNLDSGSGRVYITAELKVPAENLDKFMTDLGNHGKIEQQNVYSEDITAAYYDSKTRLETLEKTLLKYYEFLDSAETVEEQLQVSDYISNLTYEIESLKGSINRWDFLVEYSNVSLSLYAIPEIIEERIIEWSSLSLDDMGYLIQSGFVGTCSAIVNALQRFLIWLVSNSPVLIPLAVIAFFLIHRMLKKRRAQKLLKESERSSAQNQPENTEKSEH
jgi:hypothetical protein